MDVNGETLDKVIIIHCLGVDIAAIMYVNLKVRHFVGGNIWGLEEGGGCKERAVSMEAKNGNIRLLPTVSCGCRE